MNTKDLIAKIEKRYWCVTGPPNPKIGIGTEQLEYIEIGAMVRGRLTERESMLCEYVEQVILGSAPAATKDSYHHYVGNAVPVPTELLIWRIVPETDEQECTLESIKYVLGYRAHEHPSAEELFAGGKYPSTAIRYSPDDLGWWSKIYARLAIPGRDLTPFQLRSHGITVLKGL